MTNYFKVPKVSINKVPYKQRLAGLCFVLFFFSILFFFKNTRVLGTGTVIQSKLDLVMESFQLPTCC